MWRKNKLMKTEQQNRGKGISNKEQGISNHEVKGRFKFVFHFVIRYSLFLVRYS